MGCHPSSSFQGARTKEVWFSAQEWLFEKYQKDVKGARTPPPSVQPRRVCTGGGASEPELVTLTSSFSAMSMSIIVDDSPTSTIIDAPGHEGDWEVVSTSSERGDHIASPSRSSLELRPSAADDVAEASLSPHQFRKATRHFLCRLAAVAVVACCSSPRTNEWLVFVDD